VGTIELGEWNAWIGREYLDTYIMSGGAAVKVAVVTEPADIPAVVETLAESASIRGFKTLILDAAETKVHRIDQMFFACAAKLPWAQLVDEVLRRAATDEGFTVPMVVAPNRPFAEVVATHSGLDPQLVRQQLTQSVHNRVFRNKAMVLDFRMAMGQMCRARITGSQDGEANRALIEQWLTNRIPRISALKHLGLYTKIDRTNARLHFESLFHWLQIAGVPGVMMVVNVERLNAARVTDGGLRYSRQNLIDAYEILRQFIDSVDELEGLLLAVVGSEWLVDPDSRQRGFNAYPALRNRVYDEVRDEAHANPVSSLVHIGRSGVRA